MDTQAAPKQIIRNVVNMDIRRASEERVARIERIDNVVNLIYSPETAGLVNRLNIGNVVNVIEAPAEARLHHGRLAINRDSLRGAAPLSAIVMGQVTVDPELEESEIEAGVAYLSVMGQVLCPEHLAGALQARLANLHGPMHVYPRGVKLVPRSLTLDAQLLRSLEEGTQMMVTGKLKAPHVLDNELLARKIARILVTNGVLCRGENAETLLSRLETQSGEVRATVIPAGYELVDRRLVLTPSLLRALPARRLYCTEGVQIGEEVSAEALDGALDALIVRGQTLCPAALSEALAKKLDVLGSEVLFYEGALWLVEGKSELSAARLRVQEGKLTLVVRGHLSIDPDVDPGLLAETLDKVYNHGLIEGAPDQIAALQFRLGADHGHLKSRRPGEEDRAEKEGAEASAGTYTLDNIVNLDLK